MKRNLSEDYVVNEWTFAALKEKPLS
jgi:hypothetical protein